VVEGSEGDRECTEIGRELEEDLRTSKKKGWKRRI